MKTKKNKSVHILWEIQYMEVIGEMWTTIKETLPSFLKGPISGPPSLGSLHKQLKYEALQCHAGQPFSGSNGRHNRDDCRKWANNTPHKFMLILEHWKPTNCQLLCTALRKVHHKVPYRLSIICHSFPVHPVWLLFTSSQHMKLSRAT